MDKFGRSKDIKLTKKFKSEDSRAHRSNNKPVKEEKLLLESPNNVKSDIKSEPEGPPVSKSIQSAILRNIIGDFGRNDDKVKEDSVDDVVSKIISGSQDHLDEDDFESRMKKIKSQVTDKAKAGVYGKVQLGQQTAATTSISTKPDEQNNDKDLEDEAARLRRELLEMKQKIEDKTRKNRTPTPSSSSTSESESDAEEEGDEEESEDESDDDSEDGSNESETDYSDQSEAGDQEEERPSIFDIFKTTVLQKEKSKKSTHLYDDSMRKSKLVQTKTSKILKERMELLKRNTK